MHNGRKNSVTTIFMLQVVLIEMSSDIKRRNGDRALSVMKGPCKHMLHKVI